MGKLLPARKLDCLYLVFFVIHIPVMLLMDFSPLYPEAIKPTVVTKLSKYYVATYNDQFFIKPPAWFQWYLYMELLYHLPLSVWAVAALRKDDPKVPLNLLIWSVQAFLTTLTCVADIQSWVTVTVAQKTELYKLYVPYLIFAGVLGIDMYLRLARAVTPGVKQKRR